VDKLNWQDRDEKAIFEVKQQNPGFAR